MDCCRGPCVDKRAILEALELDPNLCFQVLAGPAVKTEEPAAGQVKS